MRFHMFVCCVNVNSIDLSLSIAVSGTMNFCFFPWCPPSWGGDAPRNFRCDLWFCPRFMLFPGVLCSSRLYFFLFNPLIFISVFLLKNFFVCTD